jgi:hypothetical protein
MAAAELASVLVQASAQESASEHRPAVAAEWVQVSVSVQVSAQVSARAPVSAVVEEV